AAVLGPWAMAITVASDGAFWGAAVGGDLAPKLAGGQEGHAAPPGFHLALLPLTLFPAVLLLPAGLTAGWRARAEPAVRFALCWLAPSWLVFEVAPTKLVHYTLPLFGALAWLMARALAEPPGRLARLSGAALAVLGAGVLAAAGSVAMSRVGDWSGAPWAVVAGALFAAAGAGGALLLLRRRARWAMAAAGALALGAHAALAAGVAPALRPLWLSDRTARTLAAADFDPRDGVTPGPVTVAGYEEPSLVFLLGATTELGDADDAADAVSEGRPAIVEARQEPAFRAALAGQGLAARVVGQAAGLDYSNNRRDILRIWRSPPRPPATPGKAAP
ncbi:MAG TPA: glycosyltransferase family 39 protein, partial [Caulobacteraceae bacterium]|nr:glycosyltransferase family 39 protein [Caulobacteraceae bacterium]